MGYREDEHRYVQGHENSAVLLSYVAVFSKCLLLSINELAF